LMLEYRPKNNKYFKLKYYPFFMLVYIDGKYCDEDKANIKVFDEWFLKGCALAQKIRTFNKKAFLLDEAISLLFEDLSKLSVSFGKTKQEVKDAVLQTILENNYNDAVVNIIIVISKKPYIVVLVEKLIESTPQNALRISSEYRNYELNVLQEFNIAMSHENAVKIGCVDAILTKGNTITDCAYGSLFIVKGGILYTPQGSLKRPFYGLLNSFAKIKKIKLVKKDIFDIDECFYANSVLGIIPINKIENVLISSGDIAKNFKERWHEHVAKL